MEVSKDEIISMSQQIPSKAIGPLLIWELPGPACMALLTLSECSLHEPQGQS